jgi:hypothetical protein
VTLAIVRMTAAQMLAALACGSRSCACARSDRRTHCPAHPDRHPSFDIRQRGHTTLFICRGGCTQQDVIIALERRGLWKRSSADDVFRRGSLLDAARRDVVRTVRALDAYQFEDELRACYATVREARALATSLGPESERAWELLDEASRLETATRAAEADHDA